MKFKTYTARPEDMDNLALKDCYSFAEIGASRELIAFGEKSPDSLCVSFGIDGKILGVAGSFKQWSGVSQLWALFSKEVDAYPIELTKVCQALILYAAETQELRRVSLNVRYDYTKGNQFAQRLGFDFEGRMYGFFPDGGDASLYARLF